MTWYPVYVIKPLGYKEDRSILAIWLTIIFVCFHLLLWRSFTCCPFWLEASYKFCWIINCVLPLSKLKCKTLSTILGPIGISSFSKWGVESEVMVSIPCVRELYNYLLGKKKRKSAHTVFYLHILLDGLHAFYFVCAEYQTSCVVITCFLIDIIILLFLEYCGSFKGFRWWVF